MNAWNSREVKAGRPQRVTAGGASKMLVGKVSGGSLPTVIETSWDGGTTWQVVTFAAQGANLLAWYPASNSLLGSLIRFDADCWVMQED